MSWVASDAQFQRLRGKPLQMQGLFFYSLKLLKDSIFNRINVASYVCLSLEGLAWEGKDGGCLKDTL